MMIIINSNSKIENRVCTGQGSSKVGEVTIRPGQSHRGTFGLMTKHPFPQYMHIFVISGQLEDGNIEYSPECVKTAFGTPSIILDIRGVKSINYSGAQRRTTKWEPVRALSQYIEYIQ